MSVRWLKGHHCLLIKQATLRATPVGGWPQHTSEVSIIFSKIILEPPVLYDSYIFLYDSYPSIFYTKAGV